MYLPTFPSSITTTAYTALDSTMSTTDSVIYEHDETKGRGTRTSDDDETFEMQSFLHTHPRPLRRHVIGHPLFVAFAAAVSSLLVFSLGFSMGKSGTSIAQM